MRDCPRRQGSQKQPGVSRGPMGGPAGGAHGDRKTQARGGASGVAAPERSSLRRYNAPSKKMETTMTPMTGNKRRREALTPTPTRKAPVEKKRKGFTYAQACNENKKKVVYKTNGEPINSEEVDTVFGAALDEHFVECLENDEDPPEIHNWKLVNLNGTRSLEVEFPTKEEPTWFLECIERLGDSYGTEDYGVYTRADLIKLEGWARGQTAKRLNAKALEALLLASANKRGMEGELLLMRVRPTPKGAVIMIGVDKRAMEGLKKNNFELGVGFSGAVRFSDPKERRAEREERAAGEEEKEFTAGEKELIEGEKAFNQENEEEDRGENRGEEMEIEQSVQSKKDSDMSEDQINRLLSDDSSSIGARNVVVYPPSVIPTKPEASGQGGGSGAGGVDPKVGLPANPKNK